MDDLPSLERFSPSAMTEPELSAEEEMNRQTDCMAALQTWFEVRGLDATIAALNDRGHGFDEIKSESPGWRIFRESTPNDDDFQISYEAETGDFMLLTIQSDEAFEREKAARLKGLSKHEQAAEQRRAEFYERATSISLSDKQWEELDNEERCLLAIYVFELELNNGGFAQYFDNTGGRRIEYTAGVLRRIKAPKTADLVDKAMGIVAGPYTETLSEQQYTVIESNASLAALDDGFYELDEDLSVLAMTYWSDA